MCFDFCSLQAASCCCDVTSEEFACTVSQHCCVNFEHVGYHLGRLVLLACYDSFKALQPLDELQLMDCRVTVLQCTVLYQIEVWLH